jgi:hypothetical protein
MEFGWRCLLNLYQFRREDSKEILKKTKKVYN